MPVSFVDIDGIMVHSTHGHTQLILSTPTEGPTCRLHSANVVCTNIPAMIANRQYAIGISALVAKQDGSVEKTAIDPGHSLWQEGVSSTSTSVVTGH